PSCGHSRRVEWKTLAAKNARAWPSRNSNMKLRSRARFLPKVSRRLEFRPMTSCASPPESRKNASCSAAIGRSQLPHPRSERTTALLILPRRDAALDPAGKTLDAEEALGVGLSV